MRTAWPKGLNYYGAPTAEGDRCIDSGHEHAPTGARQHFSPPRSLRAVGAGVLLEDSVLVC